ncbi:ATP-binding cassette domain-containing protein [Achromobacter insuavis]
MSLPRAARRSPCAACATPSTATPCWTASTWTCPRAPSWRCCLSGCGKSTLLKSLAGLLRPQGGSIAFGDAVVCDAQRHEPPERRGLGMVFQDYALWPHMSVAGNVAFPLEMRGVARRERPARVREALALVGLGEHAARRPSELSGGQQQRVALARAIGAAARAAVRRTAVQPGPARANRSASRSAPCCAGSAPPPSTSPTTTRKPMPWRTRSPAWNTAASPTL